MEARVMRIAALMATAVLLLGACVQGATHRVPGDVKDLAQALREAKYGDTVLVFPGKYYLQSRLKSGVKLISAAGPESTTLWNKRWHIVKMNDCDMDTEVSGFTMDGLGCNIAVACTLGAPAIVGNVIKGAWDGISLQRSNGLVKGNTIEGCNRGIAIDGGNPELVENTIVKNAEGLYMLSASPVVARCVLKSNGRAIFISGYSYPTIGGSLATANDIISSGFTVYNEGRRIEGSLYTDQREVAIATHNYWGSLCPDKGKFRGDVVYTPWVNAAHDSVIKECPPPEKAEQPAETGGGN
jgi:parallel beta-helix repeat protein